MKKVFIKYNPYKIETEVSVNGKKLAQNSKLGEMIAPGIRLQEWVEELPHILIEEYNDNDFDVNFHGTLLDYDDLTEVFTAAYNRGELTNVRLDREPAKETSDKEVLIDKVFKKIQDGPFDELRDAEILSAFEHAKSSDFEVCVVATMSAGKSTLINSMLGTKLMPSKQEACTAIIIRIKDVMDVKGWRAEVYNKDNRLVETHEKLTYGAMERLNADENVSVIKVEGNIPFVSAEDVSLVLIDTPGPNNSRDPEHRRVQSEFLSKSSKALVLYIMEGTFGSDDDNALLQRVADSMKVGGKQSKDRFIFVVNKMDDRKNEDGKIDQTLERVCTYLERYGIIKPNLFPAAALPALNIRLITSGAEVDEDTLDEAGVKVRKLNRNPNMHFEKNAKLPKRVCEDFDRQLKEAKEAKAKAERAEAKAENEEAEAEAKEAKAKAERAEALIHTGVLSVEAAIRQYVQKYAKTAKIKNIVDTFMHKLDEVSCFEETKHELAKKRDESERIVKHIELIRRNIDDANSAKKFRNAVDEAVNKVNSEAKDVIDDIVQKYQERIRKRIDAVRGEELDIDEAKDEVVRLERFAKKLEPDFQGELDELIRTNLLNTSDMLIKEYKRKLASLTEEIGENDLGGFRIDPLKLMGGSVVEADDFSVNKLLQSKEVEDGQEWIENTSKKWYKPWTWLQESGYYRKKYKTVKYVEASELAQDFLADIQNAVYENRARAQVYACRQSDRIADSFKREFKRLDDVLKHKLSELEGYASDKKKAEAQIRESKRKLDWLNQIKKDVESILEI